MRDCPRRREVGKVPAEGIQPVATEDRKMTKTRSYAELLYGTGWSVQNEGLDGRKKKPSPQTPYKENLSLSREGKGEGEGKNARMEGEGKGEVDVRQFFGKGEGEADGPLAYEDIMDPRRDAVGLALAALRIPRVNVRDGKLFNNARILRWTLARVGETAFRETLWRQLRENETDGLPRCAAAAFQDKLNTLMFGPKGGAA